MHPEYLVKQLMTDTGASLVLFSPELIVVVTILALLLVRLLSADRWLPGSAVALLGAVAGTTLAVMQFVDLTRGSGGGATQASSEFFTGLLIYDTFTVYFRIFLLLFLVFMVCLTRISGIPDAEDAPDFYTLLFGSTLGMMLMASANHILVLFLAIEMTSVPSYALVGFLKGRKLSSEASLKYVIYGAGAAGVMLYGLSLLAGLLGTAHLPAMASELVKFAAAHEAGFGDPAVRTLSLAILMVLVGFAFKLSAFPFHFWCPDAFEGASAEIAGFLSIASKGAAFALLVRFCLALVGATALEHNSLSSVYLQVGIGLGIMAAVTSTFGNLAAYSQTNIKRMLAYSTIAHAGYMLMAIAAMMVILNGKVAEGASEAVRNQAAAGCIQGILYYLAVYFFMNLGAFAIVAFIRNQIFSEKIADYAGLGRQCPVLAVCMAICLVSLIGIPPLGGFFGKFMIFASLYDAGVYHWSMWAVLVIGGLNTVFALFYYMQVLRVIFMGQVSPDLRPVDVPLASSYGWYSLAVSIPVIALGVFAEPVSRVARDVASQLFS